MFGWQVTEPVSPGCALPQVGQDVPLELARACFSNSGSTVQGLLEHLREHSHSWEHRHSWEMAGEFLERCNEETKTHCRSQSKDWNFRFEQNLSNEELRIWGWGENIRITPFPPFPLEPIQSPWTSLGLCYEDLPDLFSLSYVLISRRRRRRGNEGRKLTVIELLQRLILIPEGGALRSYPVLCFGELSHSEGYSTILR